MKHIVDANTLEMVLPYMWTWIGLQKKCWVGLLAYDSVGIIDGDLYRDRYLVTVFVEQQDY